MAERHSRRNSVKGLRPAIDYLHQVKGITLDKLIEKTGLTHEFFAHEHSTLTDNQLSQFNLNVVEQSGDPCIGLAIGRQYNTLTFEFLGYAMMCAPTLEKALLTASRFLDLTFTAAAVELSIDDEETTLSFMPFRNAPAPVQRYYIDRDIASAVTVITDILRTKIPLTSVRLGHQGYRDQASYQAWFECPVELDTPTSSLSFSSSWLAHPLPRNDAMTSQLSLENCEVLMHGFKPRGSFVHQVRQLLITSLGNFLNLEAAAEKMNMSSRTLRRRLKVEGYSWQALIDEVRFYLAKKYLAHTSAPIAEIARQLGFNDESYFSRAFKRWSGIRPGQWRRERETNTSK